MEEVFEALVYTTRMSTASSSGITGEERGGSTFSGRVTSEA